MLEKEFNISNLIAGQLKGTLNAAQENELRKWLELSEENRTLFAELSDEDVVKEKAGQYNDANTAAMWEKTLAGLDIGPVLAVPHKVIQWPRFLVAASIILIIGAGLYFYTNQAEKNPGAVNYAQDIKPGKNTATLILANGKSINLSDTQSGLVVAAASLKYTDGTAVKGGDSSLYENKNGRPELSSAAQTIRTPRGGTYQVTLSDGTRVWLNAASSLTYSPGLNEHGERRVKLDGEGYFEVAKDKEHPFIVSSNKQEVKVLGTHFNINSYSDERSIKTTLLEGSVQVLSLGATVTLKPNQQASITGSAGINVMEVNAENVIAWKNGFFMFNDEPLAAVMQKISRWYGVEVHIADQGLLRQTVYGTISRYSNVSKVLNMLEKTGEMQFEIEGNIIKVQRK